MNNQGALPLQVLPSEPSQSFSRDTSQSVQAVSTSRTVSKARQKRRLIERWVNAQSPDSPVRVETTR